MTTLNAHRIASDNLSITDIPIRTRHADAWAMANLNVCASKRYPVTVVVLVGAEDTPGWRNKDEGAPQRRQELIVEAFNVLNETGMTPRELVDAVRELRETCAEALSDMQPPGEGGLTGAEHDAGGGENTIIRLKAAISKYQPTTPA